MARLLKARWESLAGFGRAVGNKRGHWGHWSVSCRQTRVRSVAVEGVTDGSFVV